MNILVICDDTWHPALTVREGMKDLPNEGYHLDWIEDARQWSAEMMARYPLVILSKSNNISSSVQDAWMTAEVETAFQSHVEHGGGLLVIHSGTAGYRDAPVLRALIGGVFVEHPAQCLVTVEPKPSHPLTQGVEAFTLQDEHYFMALDDAQADVFLTSRSEHGDQPAGWTRSQDQGRVGVLTPGHNIPVWQHASFQALLRSTLRWCSKK
jgi:type 1 glutamine amidotransferase